MSSVRSGTSCGWKTDVAVKARDQEPESPVEWLENELRETKARLHKVEGELDQALKQVWSLEADVRRVAEAFSVSGSASAALSALREDVRQLHSQMGKTQDRHSALANRTDEMFRQRQTETGRDRQDLSEVTKQVGGVTKSIEHLENRVQSMEEASRRMEEGVAGGHLADEALERQIEDRSNDCGLSKNTPAGLVSVSISSRALPPFRRRHVSCSNVRHSNESSWLNACCSSRG